MSESIRVLPSTQERASRLAAFTLCLLLIALCLAWELLLQPTGQGWLALKALPLLPALPGLWRYRMYTYRWVSLLVWVYATEGLVRGPSGRGLEAILGWAEVGLAVALFTACTLQIRQRLAAAKRAQAS
ncbi:putative membrane protein [Inhella inkyongensis]|uniref:Putative membrane protein n=1 Tax=Inhella inkyongensis TaxID=392593 RepID=A0A840S4N8_9BURK|nr:DUF2069 domain-containing protein [Inhella inkyongensis]MBB5205345.1 putative membrane protein [Inhella inkyongensis]